MDKLCILTNQLIPHPSCFRSWVARVNQITIVRSEDSEDSEDTCGAAVTRWELSQASTELTRLQCSKG